MINSADSVVLFMRNLGVDASTNLEKEKGAKNNKVLVFSIAEFMITFWFFKLAFSYANRLI